MLTLVRVQKIEQFGAMRLLHLVEDVGDAVGRHAGKQLCRGFPRHQLDNFGFVLQPRLVEHLDGAIGRQLQQNRGREFQRHVVDGFDDVGRAFVEHAGGKECGSTISSGFAAGS